MLSRNAVVALALQAIADGYDYRVQDIGGGFPHGYILVDNPDFEEDNGNDPYLLIEYV